jgi:SAM-dependent methyltransferase/uncharacterized protein YbaR (Trm112 family)
VKRRLLDWLACPLCRSVLDVQVDAGEGDEILEGRLRCVAAHTYEVRGGIPRMVPGAAAHDPAEAGTMAAVRRRFEFQWRTWGGEERLFGQTDEDMAHRLVGPYTAGRLQPSTYEGALVLDAGCGHGRYLPGFAGFGAEVVGMDYGDGIEQAAARYGDHPRMHFVQGDVMRPPFRVGAFDIVFSFGVLQFTPSTERAFSRLAALVRPGGYFYTWVYPKGGRLWEWSQSAIRAVTTRLPDRLLYWACFLPVPLLSIAPTYSGTSLANSTWRQCAQVVWDWYSPRYQWHHTREEVRDWHEAAGFGEVTWLDVPIGAIGRKTAGTREAVS